MATHLASRTLRKSRSLAVQLVSTLQARIKDGTYLAGMRMPTEDHWPPEPPEPAPSSRRHAGTFRAITTLPPDLD